MAQMSPLLAHRFVCACVLATDCDIRYVINNEMEFEDDIFTYIFQRYAIVVGTVKEKGEQSAEVDNIFSFQNCIIKCDYLH